MGSLFTVVREQDSIDVHACDVGAAARAAAAPLNLRSGDVVEVYRGRVLEARFRTAEVNPTPRERRRLERQIAKLEEVDCAEVAKCRRTIQTTRGPRRIPCPESFKTKGAALAATLEANPELARFVQDEWSSKDQAFVLWLRDGRRGPKPRLDAGDGRFDPLNERWELRGARAVSSWSEAVYRTMPSSRRWSELPGRLEVLAEAVGFDLAEPDEVLRLEAEEDDYVACLEGVDAQLRELLAALEEDDGAAPF